MHQYLLEQGNVAYVAQTVRTLVPGVAVRTVAPLTVRWASCWAAVQYICANGGSLTRVSFQSTASRRDEMKRSRRDEASQNIDGRGGRLQPCLTHVRLQCVRRSS